MTKQTRCAFGLSLALLALPALPGAAQALQAQPAQASPLLANAKTIQFQETLRRREPGSAPLLPNHIAVSIERPKIKMVITSAANSRVDQYVYDGKTEYQYDGGNKNYSATPLAPSAKSQAQVRGMAAIDLVLLNGVVPAPEAGVTRVVSADTVNGKALTLITDTQSVALPNKSVVKIIGKIWSDAGTRLPVRLTATVITKGIATVAEDLSFSGWVFDQPLTPDQIAWVPPAGAKLFDASGNGGLLAVGTPAPDFSAVTPDGKTVHLSDYKGKVVVLDFWATWCGPCQRSMPKLEKVYQQVKDKNVAVLGLCVWDQKAAYDKWIAANAGTKYHFPLAFDPAGHGADSIASKLYNVSGIPTQYVIDKNGKVAAAYTGYSDSDVQLETALIAQGIAVPLSKTPAAKTPAVQTLTP